MPRTAQRIADELHELLLNAKVASGPYVLVAHSFGAHIARCYANRYAESLKGVVLVEPADEERSPGTAAPAILAGGLIDVLPPMGFTRMKRMYRGEAILPPVLKTALPPFRNRYIIWSPVRQLEAEKSELASMRETEAEVRATRFPPELPLIVISATRGKDPKAHFAMQDRLARLSPTGRHLVSDGSNHFVQMERPQLVLDAIREIR
jgi:pimeloyl-ACP methyl ester carboxylesterase